MTPGDLAAVMAARGAVGALDGRVGGLGSPGAMQRSADGDAALFTVALSSPQDSVTSVDTRAVTAVRQAVAPAASRARDGLHAAVTGDAAVTADSGSTTLSGLLLSSAIVIVLVFGVASDYALLLVHRYREELRHHAACEEAMAAALRAVLPTLAASAATVTGAMLCLLAAESGSLHGLGSIGAVAVASAFLAGTTFLPALLLILGRAAFWPRIPAPGAPGAETSRAWAAIGARAARRPVAVALSTVLVLGLACAGLMSLRISSDPLNDLKGHPGSIAGEQLLAAHFPAGAIAPLVLLAPRSEAETAAHLARDTVGVATVTPDPPVSGYAADSVVLSVSPYNTSRHQNPSRHPAQNAYGAGKTTTISIFATLTRPDVGIARVLGHDVTSEPHAVRAGI